MYMYLLIALPALLVAQKGSASDYDRGNHNNPNPASTVSCVLDADKSGAYRPACQGEEIKCKQGEDCVIECLGRSDRCSGQDSGCKPCYGATFIGAGGYDMSFTCEGDTACQGVTIVCPERQECNIRLAGGNGNAGNGMKDAVITGAFKGTLKVENNQANNGMNGASITCPEEGQCQIMASSAYETTSEAAFSKATIDGSLAEMLYLDAEDATRPFINANVFCPPREKNRSPSCEVEVKGGQGMLQEMRLHVDDSLEDVIIRCAYTDDADEECFGYSSGYDGDDAMEMQPTLDCSAANNERNGYSGKLDFDCLLYLDTTGYDSFTCINFNGDDGCVKGDGGVCSWDEDAGYDEQRAEDRAGSKCNRAKDQESCDAEPDCIWQSTGESSQSRWARGSDFVAAAVVQVGDAVASNSLYFAAIALFGSSAAVYYCACSGSGKPTLTFNDDE